MREKEKSMIDTEKDRDREGSRLQQALRIKEDISRQ